jgi:hypothetical protein
MRLLRHLSFSNVIALLALFIALGGAAYAGTKINGSSIKNGSVGGGKLKNETITAGKLKKGTITAAQIRNETLTGAQIEVGSIDASKLNLSGLGTVPLAQAAITASKADSAKTATTAATATSADIATHAESAGTAKTAETATSATTAETATSATTATNADNATHADQADSATHADTATSAATAGEADTLNGETAEDLTVACHEGTEFYGGMCWDEEARPARLWLGAVVECGNAGGRLPSIEELIAFILQPGEQAEEETWSGDLDSIEAGVRKEVVFTADEAGRSTVASGLGGTLGYRCVFPQSN